MKRYWVYILTNKRHSVRYVGMTTDLGTRVLQHKLGHDEKAFTRKYKCNKLVWYQEQNDPEQAALQERRVKRWRREWKDELINAMNPEWKDLSEGWYDERDLEPGS